MTKVLKFIQQTNTLRQHCLLVLFFAFSFVSAFAQQTRIVGRVLEQHTNEPVAGANIILVNANTGTITDHTGSFSIVARSFPVTLKISFLGYKTTEIEIYEYTEPITVFLNEDLNLQNEIVVVGYGTQRRKELTGSVASVPKDLLSRVTPSFDNTLSGAAPGISVIQSSGQPGATSTIRIRGGNSITGGNEPLYVIDGFIVYNDNSNANSGVRSTEIERRPDSEFNLLATINPSDIESIEILKDASATAIYGTRGANGVIIITTKKGNDGPARINYQSSFGWGTIAKKVDWMNTGEWAPLYKELTGQDWWNAYSDPTQITDRSRSYDWQSEALRTGLSQNHQLSISGGDKDSRYAISGGYLNQEGILKNTDFSRYTVRVNLDQNVFKDFRIGLNAIGNHSKQNGLSTAVRNVPNTWVSILRTPPVVPVYNPDGSFNHVNPFSDDSKNEEGLTANPIYDLLNTISETNVNRVLGNFFAEYQIVNGLKAKVALGADLLNSKQNYYAPILSAAGIETNGYASSGSKTITSWQSEFTLNYEKQINNDNFISGLIGYTSQRSDLEAVQAIATNFLNDITNFNSLQSASGATIPYSEAATSILSSYIGRVNYSYLSRYNLTATIRADGSSRFAPGHKWGYFPSIGLSWNVNEENFLKSFRELNSLKFRISAGTTGNQEFGDYQYLKRLEPENYSFDGSAIVVGYVPVNVANPDLRWEKTAQYNFGIDGGLWNDRLNFTADVYYKKTTDLLLELPVETTTGYSTLLTNIGSVSNKGVEFGINADVIKNRNFNWNTSFNWSRNINKVLDLGGQDEFPIDYPSIGSLSYAAPLVVKVGEPLGTFSGYIFDGVIQIAEEAANAPVNSWLGANYVMQVGDAKYVDKNNDGSITAADRDIAGNSQPDFIFGFNNSLSYKRFDLSFSLQGSYGNKLYNALRNRAELTTTLNTLSSLANRWTAANPSTEIPRATSQSNFNFDSRFVEDASYIKIRNITLGYSIPFQLRSGVKEKIRVFFTAQNLFTITNYSGYDPEASRSGGSEQSNLLQGIDYGSYPSSKNFLVGFEITL